MKRLLGFIFLFGLFVSCEGPMGPQGPQGYPGKDGEDGESGTSWLVRDVKIEWDMWEEAEDVTGPYLYYEIPEKKLTNYVLMNSIMETYYRYKLEEKGSDRYVPLSYSDFWTGKEEYFTVEYTLGYITIIYKNSTGEVGPELDAYDFQVRIMW